MPRFLVRSMLFTLLAAVAVVPLACDDDEDTTGPGENVQVIRLTDDLTFEPDSVSIEPGTTVRWINDSEDIEHTVTARDENQPEAWASEDMTEGGQEFERIFTAASAGETYDYFCIPHEADGMEGKIVVEGS